MPCVHRGADQVASRQVSAAPEVRLRSNIEIPLRSDQGAGRSHEVIGAFEDNVLNFMQTCADACSVLNLFGSIRSAAVVALAGATFAAPVVVKGDALAQLAGSSGPAAPATEQVVAGGFAFAKPEAWGRMGAGAAEAAAGDQAGTVVSGLCPAGGDGVACKGGVQLTFVAYDGVRGKLPLVTSFEEQLDAKLGKRMRGFRKVGAAARAASDGTRWLRYEFDARGKREVLGVFRRTDGSGVVVVVVGSPAALERHGRAVDSFLAGAAELAPEASSGGAAH